jgi:hypothetical protein
LRLLVAGMTHNHVQQYPACRVFADHMVSFACKSPLTMIAKSFSAHLDIGSNAHAIRWFINEIQLSGLRKFLSRLTFETATSLNATESWTLRSGRFRKRFFFFFWLRGLLVSFWLGFVPCCALKPMMSTTLPARCGAGAEMVTSLPLLFSSSIARTRIRYSSL